MERLTSFFADRKYNRDPRQQELADIMINVCSGHCSAEDVFRFVTSQGWRHPEIASRTRYAAWIVRKRRPEAYADAKKIADMFRLKF